MHSRLNFLKGMCMKVGIIGNGKVGTALGNGLKTAGHDVRYGHRDPRQPAKDAAMFGDAIILAVPFSSVKDVAKDIGDHANGKVVIDVTNNPDLRGNTAMNCNTSGAETLQHLLPGAHIVKAFNTIFSQNMTTGQVGNERLSLFVAGDDPQAKRSVMGLGTDIGFESIDAGPLRSARYLEPMGSEMITLGYDLGMGTDIGYRLVRIS